MTIRNAELSDQEQVVSLLIRMGLGTPEISEKIRGKWLRFWRDNPALRMDRPAPALGWVLEAEGRVVGFFGNIPRRYLFGDRTLLVSVASNWAVEKPFRTHTNDLATAYFGQKVADMLMVTTAVLPTAKIFNRFSGSAMPQSDFEKVFYWVIDAEEFLEAAFRRKNVSRTFARPLAYALSPILKGVVSLQRRRPGRLIAGLEPEAVKIEDVGDEFDGLWRRKLDEERRLYAYRTAEDIRWTFKSSAESGSLTMLRCRRGGRLEGYLALIKDEMLQTGLIRVKIADMLVASNDSDVIDALLAAAYESAGEQSCHILDLFGLPREIRDRALKYKPFSRKYPDFPFYYKALSDELDSALKSEDSWYPSLYDGDSVL